MSSVWIINQYATHPAKGSMSRHFMLGRELVKLGYDITIITSTGHYFLNNPPSKFGWANPEFVDGVRFVWLKTPKYNQSQKVIRVLAWFLFTLQLFFMRKIQEHKPDFIWHSSPSLLPFLGSYFLSRRYQSKLCFEFRDVWPLTLTSLGGYSKFHPFIMLHAQIERFALKSCDICVSTLEFGWLRLKELKLPGDKFFWIPNGVETSEFPTAEKSGSGQPKSETFTFGYVGTVGVANALDVVVDAANILKYENISITITGEGSEKIQLQQKAKRLNLSNVKFLKKVSKKDVPAALNQTDACILSWQPLELYRFGTSANKSAEYLAAGKPIVQSYSGAGDFVSTNSVGITVPAGDAEALADAMMKISEADSKRLEQYSENARAAAKAKYDFRNLAIKVSELMSK